MTAHASAHPTDQTLSAFGLGKLDDASAEGVHLHLEDCPACRRRVSEMSSDSFLSRIRGARLAGEESALVPGLRNSGPIGPNQDRPHAETLPPDLTDSLDYEVIRELGRGGMGVVYLVRNTLMGRHEVLKVMGRHLVTRPGVVERFVREIQSVARLTHDNIVSAYSATRVGDSIVFAMEHVEGLDLGKLVRTKGPLPVPHACRFIQQAALGLQHAHEKGMVHRDIKPGNLMLTKVKGQPVVKVLDFGLAKVTREVPTDGKLTSDGQMLGTPDYIAPEQIRDAQSADIRADIYSLGCTLYYLLTGGPPFAPRSCGTCIRRISRWMRSRSRWSGRKSRPSWRPWWRR